MKQRDGVVREVTCEDNIRCCDVIPQMNHWWRDGQKRFRCAAGGHPFQPYAGTKMMPGYMLCLYGNDGVTYIRAEVPKGKAETKLALLKIMMEPKNLLAIVHDETSFGDFWNVIDATCNDQFCIVSQHSAKVSLEVPQPRFQVQESRTSLKRQSIGQELPMVYADPAEVKKKFSVNKTGKTSWTRCSHISSLIRSQKKVGPTCPRMTAACCAKWLWVENGSTSPPSR